MVNTIFMYYLEPIWLAHLSIQTAMVMTQKVNRRKHITEQLSIELNVKFDIAKTIANDREKHQPWVLYYPSGVRLEIIRDYFVKALNDLHVKYDFNRVMVIAIVWVDY